MWSHLVEQDRQLHLQQGHNFNMTVLPGHVNRLLAFLLGIQIR